MTTALLLAFSTAFSQESSPQERPSSISSPHNQVQTLKPSPEEDIRAMRQMMEEQSLKIEAISQQVAKLARMISEAQPGIAAKPVEEPAQSAPTFTTPSPSAPATLSISGSNATHVVAKGETLTSIAKHSKVTVAELLKLNKIENDRTLQIGQSLILPAPKPQETPVTSQPK